MFRKLTDRFTKRVTNKATEEVRTFIHEPSTVKPVIVNIKESVKEEFAKDVQDNIPKILTFLTIGVGVLMAVKSFKTTSNTPNTITIINNYYYGGGTNK